MCICKSVLPATLHVPIDKHACTHVTVEETILALADIAPSDVYSKIPVARTLAITGPNLPFPPSTQKEQSATPEQSLNPPLLLRTQANPGVARFGRHVQMQNSI